MAVAIIPHRTLFCSKEIFKYNRHNLLGHGSYSHVFHGTFRFNEVAMKRLVSTPSLTEDEVKHHKRLNRENVLELLAVIDTNNFRFMVLELCSGSLFQVIQKTFDGPALPSDRDVMYQIAAGLNYVHSQNLVHLDIKPENILISTNGQMKLADFGLCMENKRGVCILNGSVRGTYSWMAPEVFPRDGSNMNKVSAMADVFSCGCVFFVFLSREDGGIHPFGDRNSHPVTIQNNIREGNQVNMAGIDGTSLNSGSITSNMNTNTRSVEHNRNKHSLVCVRLLNNNKVDMYCTLRHL